MKSFQRILFGALVFALCVSAFATDVTGKWKGKLQIEMPKAKDAQQQKQMDAARKMIQAITITLQLKADHTFSSTVVANGRTQTDNGTWVLDGNSLTLNAKANNKPHAEKFTVGKGGKTLTTDLPAPAHGKAIFTKS